MRDLFLGTGVEWWEIECPPALVLDEDGNLSATKAVLVVEMTASIMGCGDLDALRRFREAWL